VHAASPNANDEQATRVRPFIRRILLDVVRVATKSDAGSVMEAWTHGRRRGLLVRMMGRFSRRARLDFTLPLALTGVVLTAVIGGCATAHDEPLGQETSAVATAQSSSSSGSTAASSATASSGAGGAGGASASASSSSGAGGASASASSSSGAGGASASSASASSSSGGGGMGGASPVGTVLMLAGSASTTLAGLLHTDSSWTTASLASGATADVAIATTSDGKGLGLVRSNQNAGELRFTHFDGLGFTPLAAVAANVTTREAPSICGRGMDVVAAFQGDDFKHYYASYNGVWNPVAELVGGVGSPSFGPTPPAIATLGGDSVIAFRGDDGNVYDQTRGMGGWQGANGHAVGSTVHGRPSMVALTSSPELIIAFERESDSAVFFTTRSGGNWTAPAPIANALSVDRLALAPLAQGSALLAFRGLDGMIYTTRFAAGAWSAVSPLASPNVSTPAAPSVAAGTVGADAELAYVDSMTGAAHHCRLVGNAWSAPALVGGANLTSVAIATSP